MSLSIAIKTSGGLILAVDSRLTVARPKPGGGHDHCFLDCGSKVWLLGPPNPSVAVSFYGSTASGLRSATDLIAEFGREQTQRKDVEVLARELHAFLMSRGLREASFALAGFDGSGYYGRVFELTLPGSVSELHGAASFGLSLGGMCNVATAVVGQLDIPFDHLPLQGGLELAEWLIDVTTQAQGYSLGLAGVGGPVRAALIERGRGARLV